jgi:hypothetical protein
MNFFHLESRQRVDNRPIQAAQSVPADACLYMHVGLVMDLLDRAYLRDSGEATSNGLLRVGIK